MAVRKDKATAEKPPRDAKGIGRSQPKEKPPGHRPRPSEPFEECGPSGGYGGAGVDDETKEE